MKRKSSEHTNCLHDHRVDFVRAELQLVTRQRVRETQCHGTHILSFKPWKVNNQIRTYPKRKYPRFPKHTYTIKPTRTCKQRRHLAANATHKLINGAVMDAGDAQLFLDGVADLPRSVPSPQRHAHLYKRIWGKYLGVGDGQLFRETLIDNGFRQKLLQVFAEFALNNRSGSSKRIRGIDELLKSLEFHLGCYFYNSKERKCSTQCKNNSFGQHRTERCAWARTMPLASSGVLKRADISSSLSLPSLALKSA